MEEFWTTVLALGSAALLGGLVGLERQIHGRWAGLRTHMMVALGAALFVHVVTQSPGDAGALSRVIQGITTGVGFIGGGTILKLTDRMEVKGLTTASTIWLAAAIGSACGMKHYGMAGVAVLLTLVILVVLGKAEEYFLKRKHAPQPGDSSSSQP
jgi:putative Mg2+ transporter-C (MgtC) family protein